MMETLRMWINLWSFGSVALVLEFGRHNGRSVQGFYGRVPGSGGVEGVVLSSDTGVSSK